MSLKHIIGLMLTLALCAGFAAADQQGDLPITGETIQQLRMVDGGLCQDLPDDQGSPSSLDPYHYEYDRGGVAWCLGPDGVTDDLRGCVVQFYDSNWNLLREDEIDPGEYTPPAPESTAFWQRFNCHVVDYSCDSFTSEGCGENGEYARCSDNEMLRVRECSDNAPESVETERCIPWNECYTPSCQYTVSDWGPCRNGHRERVITDTDCETRTETESCAEGCSDPQGEPSDTYCSDNNLKYYCNGESGAWQRIGSCSSGESGGSGDEDSFEFSVAKDLSAKDDTVFWDPTNRVLTGKVKITNNGEDMTDTHLLEMQIIPKGENPFAFVSSQKTCDPNYPENVHKNFMLDANETATIELNVPFDDLPNGIGNYDVFFLTRHKCENQLTQEELEHYNEFQVVGPYEDRAKIATVTVGNSLVADAKDSTLMMILPFILMIGGILASMAIHPYVGGTMFVAGLISWLVPTVL